MSSKIENEGENKIKKKSKTTITTKVAIPPVQVLALPPVQVLVLIQVLTLTEFVNEIHKITEQFWTSYRSRITEVEFKNKTK